MSDEPEEEPTFDSDEREKEFKPAFLPEELIDGPGPALAEQAEALRDGSELVGDRLDTIVLGTNGFGELANFFIVDKDDPDPKENEHNGTGIGSSVSAIENNLGQYTDMNGFIAYIPRSGEHYCLMASTEKNRAAVQEMGYEGNNNVGVYSFHGNEVLATRPGAAVDPTFLNAQIELLKQQSEHDSTKFFMDQAAEQSDQEEYERQKAQYEAEELGVKDARDYVAKIATEQPYMVRRFA